MSTTKAMKRVLATCIVLIGVTGCTRRLPDVYYMPANVTLEEGSISGRPIPTPDVLPNYAPPEIQRMYFNTLHVERTGHGLHGRDQIWEGHWNGSFVTSTNVASIEVRTNLFSIDVPRRAFGRFAFSVDVLDLPPIFVRDYRLRVIARNSAGVTSEEDMPFHIR